jgi:ribonuclease HI
MVILRMKVTIYTDGACEPINPCGAAAASFVAVNDLNEVMHKAVEVLGVGRGMTNNFAELSAIAGALIWAADKGYDYIKVCSDSQLAVNLLNGRWHASPSKGYYPAYETAVETLNALREMGIKVEIVWVRRNSTPFSAMADEMAFKAAKQAWERFEKEMPELAMQFRRVGQPTNRSR